MPENVHRNYPKEKVYLTSCLVKTIFLFVAIAVIFAASCTPDGVKVNLYNPPGDSTSIPGNFIVKIFANSFTHEDSTVVFNGYVFTFGTDGKVIAVKDNQTTSGNYLQLRTADNKLEIGLYFYNTPLNYLNEYWQVQSISNSSIELSDGPTALEFTAQ